MKIYALDGSTQCSISPSIPPEQMARELTDAGIPVLEMRSQRTPLIFPAVCGQPTGQANVYDIDPAYLAKAMSLPSRFQPWLFDVEQIEVYKFDGSIQCQPETQPVSAETAKAELESAGITVMAVRKGQIGLVPQTCGYPTGMANIALIPTDGYAKAVSLGYTLLSMHLATSNDPSIAVGFDHLLDIQGLRLGMLSEMMPIDDPEGPLPWPKPRPQVAIDWPNPGRPLPINWPFPKPPFPGDTLHPHQRISELPGHVCRIIRPGDAITMDMRRERFNIRLDENDMIVEVGFY